MASTLKPEWLDPNKMRVETGHKSFDTQCRAVLRGQQVGDCVVSWILTRTDNWRDLSLFFLPPDQAQRLRDALNQACAHRSQALVYQLFYRRGDRRSVVGWIGTDPLDDRLLFVRTAGGRQSQRRVLDWVAPYVSHGETAWRF